MFTFYPHLLAYTLAAYTTEAKPTTMSDNPGVWRLSATLMMMMWNKVALGMKWCYVVALMGICVLSSHFSEAKRQTKRGIKHVNHSPSSSTMSFCTLKRISLFFAFLFSFFVFIKWMFILRCSATAVVVFFTLLILDSVLSLSFVESCRACCRKQNDNTSSKHRTEHDDGE